MALQRDTFANIMVRVQLLEKQASKRNKSELTFATNNRDSGMKELQLPSALSRNNFSSITKDIESTESSFARALPKSLEPRKESFVSNNKREDPYRAASLPRGINAPRQTSDNELDAFDFTAT